MNIFRSQGAALATPRVKRLLGELIAAILTQHLNLPIHAAVLINHAQDIHAGR